MQGQPPIGSSPATGPTPNAGNAVKGNQIVGAGLAMLSLAVPLLGPGSPIGQKILKALTDIGKDLPPGATTQAGEKNALEGLMMRQQSMGPAMAAQRQGMPPAGGAPPPAAPPPGA
jgi:hypothetical protein